MDGGMVLSPAAWLLRQARDSEGQVLLALGSIGVLTISWVLFWPVPTEVVGRGVFIEPNRARVIDSRAEGQISAIPVQVGQEVRRGQTLITLYLPTLDQQLRREERDLRELRLINADLNRRDAGRLRSALRVRETALAKLGSERRRLVS